MSHHNLLHVIRYIAEEVDRQGRGAIQVYNMCEAWDYAIRRAQDQYRKDAREKAGLQS